MTSITIFTSNQPRHLNLVNSLSKVSERCFVIQECSSLFPGLTQSFYRKSDAMRIYFESVMKAESKFFGENKFVSDKCFLKSMSFEDLNLISREEISEAMESDVFVVFGSSFIKGWLVDELVEKNAINIHMGLSPYYRGASCNFWAAAQNNPHLVGATIHKLSRGLDSGDILYHALPKPDNCDNVFEFTMKSVLSAHKSLVKRITTREIFGMKPFPQDRSKEILYSKNVDFTDDIAIDFLNRNQSFSEFVDHSNVP